MGVACVSQQHGIGNPPLGLGSSYLSSRLFPFIIAIRSMGRGQLVFKGEQPKKKKKKAKYKTSDEVADDAAPFTQATAMTDSARLSTDSMVASSQAVPCIQKGLGKITTSGTVVTGHGTQFNRQLNVGDAMLVMIDGQQQMRVITIRLSDTSINLSSAFSPDLKHPSDFSFIPKPRSTKGPSDLSSSQGELKQEEQAAFGTFASNRELVYQEKTEHGSYRIKKQQLAGEATRSDLLAMRAKKKSDKYCF